MTTPTPCILDQQQQEELLFGYLDKSLNADTAGSYQRHLTACVHCRELVELHSLVSDSLNEWTAPAVSENFDAQLFAKIRASGTRDTEAASTASRGFWESLIAGFAWLQRPAFPLALATCALLAVLAFRFLSPDFNPEKGNADDFLANKQGALQETELQQVERALEDMEALQALSAEFSADANAPDGKDKTPNPKTSL